MKKRVIYLTILFFTACISLLSSCKKSFLEVTPKGKLIATKTSDYDMLLNTFLAFNLLNVNLQVPMGDEIAAMEPYLSATDLRTQRLFKWSDNIYEPEQDPAEQSLLTLLYSLNIIINEVMQSEGGTEQQKKSIQAEALADRAWIYFLLINYYGKPYNGTSSATDPGFPIIRVADVTQSKFERATVKEVYDFIVSDLTTAIPSLPPQVTHRIRISKGAAEGLLGKVYMHMGKFNDALTQLDAGLTNMTSSTSVPVRLYDYNVEFATGGIFLPINPLLGPPFVTGINNVENALFKQFLDTWAYYGNEFVIPPQVSALYSTSDLRRNFLTPMQFPSGNLPTGFYRKYGRFVVGFGVVLPDIYLLRAEAKARLNDLSGAKQDVEAFRVKRMPAADATVPSAIATNQINLVKFILEERIREFAMEGQRWFDMRRLSVDPTYSNTVGTSHIAYSATGTPMSTFTLRPERLTLKIPPKILNQNPGMQDNP